VSDKLKNGMGDASEHPENRQNERGAGVTNTPLKKSPTNPEQPSVREAKARAPSTPVERPNEPLGKRGHVAQDEIAAKGRNSTGSTFRAPRKEGSREPTEAGFTHLGKV